MKSDEDKSAVTPAQSEATKSPRGLLYELIMKATQEYNETVAARWLAELAEIYPELLD
jgi:hypothetical protein